MIPYTRRKSMLATCVQIQAVARLKSNCAGCLAILVKCSCISWSDVRGNLLVWHVGHESNAPVQTIQKQGVKPESITH